MFGTLENEIFLVLYSWFMKFGATVQQGYLKLWTMKVGSFEPRTWFVVFSLFFCGDCDLVLSNKILFGLTSKIISFFKGNLVLL